MDSIIRRFGSLFDSHIGTCSIDNLKDDHITFVRNVDAFNKLVDTKKYISVFVPDFLVKESKNLPKNISILSLNADDSIDYVFTVIHNGINSGRNPQKCEIDPFTYLGAGVVIGAEGLKIVRTPDGRLIQFKHMGNVIIGNSVFIEANTVVHRGCLDSTIIRDNVIIGSLCNIGHNCEIDEGSILTTHIALGGSSKIGKRCWLGMSTVIKQKISICDDVLLGMGSIVTKDITKPGVYFGSPVKRMGDWNGEWITN